MARLALLVVGAFLAQAFAFESEWFMIRNRNTGKCIDVRGFPGVKNNANIQQWDCENPYDTKHVDQVWSMDQFGRLRSRPSGKCLDVVGNVNKNNGVNMVLWPCETPSTRTDHLWEFKYQGDYFQIVNKNTHKCVDVHGYSSKRNGENIMQWACQSNPKDEHFWYLVPIWDQGAHPQGCLPTEGPWFMLRQKNTGKCVDVKGFPGSGNNANIQTWECENPIDVKHVDQVWRMDQYGRLISRPSGKCLDVVGNVSKKNGVNLVLWPCEKPSSHTDHLWQFVHDKKNPQFFWIKNRNTGKCLDVIGHSAGGNGKNIDQWTCQTNPRDDHYWYKVPVYN